MAAAEAFEAAKKRVCASIECAADVEKSQVEEVARKECGKTLFTKNCGYEMENAGVEQEMFRLRARPSGSEAPQPMPTCGGPK